LHPAGFFVRGPRHDSEIQSGTRFLPIESAFRQPKRRTETTATGDEKMGKGNNSQKNDKKSMKPKQDKKKPAAKK
jgi:hypothetical protein